MRRAMLLLLAGACGRVKFDARATDAAADGPVCVAPAGHDEDADGVDDACDLCPALADDQLDTDGDGVGDACDPQPAVATDRILMFEPFLVDDAPWQYIRAVRDNDELTLAATAGTSVATLPQMTGREDVTMTGRTTLLSTPRQLSLQMAPSAGTSAYYCELYDDASTFFLSATYTLDGVNYVSVDKQVVPGALADGPFVLTFIRTPPDFGCTATWAGATYHVEGPIPAGITQEVISIVSSNLATAVTSFTRIGGN